MYHSANKVNSRKTAHGYGIALSVILMMTTLITTVSIQMILSGAALPGMQNAIRNSTMAQSVAISAFPAVRTQIQTLLNLGTDIPVGYSLPVGYITTPNDPSSLGGATTQIGSYTATVTKKGGDYYLISVIATVNGAQTTEVRSLTIKPVTKNVRFIGRAAGDTLSGTSTQSYLGGLTAGGDVDGDGYDDIVIGAPQADGGGADSGEVYLVFGRPSVSWNNLTDANNRFNLTGINGVNTGDNNTIRFIGRNAGDAAGKSVFCAGDIDGDGYDDIAIGALLADSGGTDLGEAYVIFGRSRANWNSLTDSSGNFNLDNINGTNTGDNNTLLFKGTNAWDQVGGAVALGDLDGDKIDDVIIGAFGADDGGTDSGATFILFGRTKSAWNSITDTNGLFVLNTVNGIGGNKGIRIIGRNSVDLSGIAVAAGDADGDGLDDVLIGASFVPSGNYFGEVYLVFGRTSANWNTLAPGGAYNMDNIDGAHASENAVRFSGEKQWDQAGRVLGFADIDGDGKEDVLIGETGTDYLGGGSGEDSGNIDVIFGRDLASWKSLMNGSGYFALNSINGVDTGDNNCIRIVGGAGHVLFRVAHIGGDVDGDGKEDLLIGSDSAPSNGEAYLLFGRSRTGLNSWNSLTNANGNFLVSNITGVASGDNHVIRFIGRASGDRVGIASVGKVDANGDGLNDILIGARDADGGGADSGEAYIIWGRNRTAWNTLTNSSGNVSLLTLFP